MKKLSCITLFDDRNVLKKNTLSEKDIFFNSFNDKNDDTEKNIYFLNSCNTMNKEKKF